MKEPKRISGGIDTQRRYNSIDRYEKWKKLNAEETTTIRIIITHSAKWYKAREKYKVKLNGSNFITETGAKISTAHAKQIIP